MYPINPSTPRNSASELLRGCSFEFSSFTASPRPARMRCIRMIRYIRRIPVNAVCVISTTIPKASGAHRCHSTPNQRSRNFLDISSSTKRSAGVRLSNPCAAILSSTASTADALGAAATTTGVAAGAVGRTRATAALLCATMSSTSRSRGRDEVFGTARGGSSPYSGAGAMRRLMFDKLRTDGNRV